MKRHSLLKERWCFWFQTRSPPQLWEEGTDSNFWMSLTCIQSKRGWTPKLIIQTLPWEGTAAQEISDHFPAASLSPTDKITRPHKPYEWNPNLKWQDKCVHQHNCCHSSLEQHRDNITYQTWYFLLQNYKSSDWKGFQATTCPNSSRCQLQSLQLPTQLQLWPALPLPLYIPLNQILASKTERLVAWIRRFRD